MPSFLAQRLARFSSREAMARILSSRLLSMPGSTFATPILAVLMTPQRTGSITPSPELAKLPIAATSTIADAWNAGQHQAASMFVLSPHRNERDGSERQRRGLDNIRKRADAPKQHLIHRLVDLNQADGVGAGGGAAEMEGGDVDLLIAQQRSQPADEARLVEIGEIEHVPAELRLDGDALDLHQPRLAAAEERPRHLARLALGGDGEPDQRLEMPRAAVLDLAHLDVALSRDYGRVHHVDIVQQRGQQPGERDGGQRACVELGRMAFIFDADGFQARAGELAGEAAELLGQRQI